MRRLADLIWGLVEFVFELAGILAAAAVIVVGGVWFALHVLRSAGL